MREQKPQLDAGLAVAYLLYSLAQNAGVELVQNSCMLGAGLGLPGVFKYQYTSLELTE